MTTYTVTLANANDGSVHGHKAGCADLKRGKAYSQHRDEQFTVKVATKAQARAEYNSDFDYDTDGWYTVEWLPCAKHVPAGVEPEDGPKAETVEETTTEAVEAPEKTADAVKAWPGNYNTVFAPAAELFAGDLDVWTVNVTTMLKETHTAGPGAEELAASLATVEQEALAALRNWQKTLDRKGQTDMEKYNQNRSYLAGYLAVAAQQATGAKKRPSVAFAKDMERAIRTDALAAGTAARKEATK